MYYSMIGVAQEMVILTNGSLLEKNLPGNIMMFSSAYIFLQNSTRSGISLEKRSIFIIRVPYRAPEASPIDK